MKTDVLRDISSSSDKEICKKVKKFKEWNEGGELEECLYESQEDKWEGKGGRLCFFIYEVVGAH